MSWFKDNHEYMTTKVQDDQDTDSTYTPENIQISSHSKKNNKLKWISIVLFTNIMTAIILTFITRQYQIKNLDNTCARFTTSYSPLSDEIDYKYLPVSVNGSLFKETIYRRDPSPEVDEAWHAIGSNYRPMTIPYEKGLRSGLTDKHIKVKKKYGGGFVVFVEGLHHLHCLNLLRQTSHWNYPYYQHLGGEAFKDPLHFVKLHATHCLDILRQRLMCDADTSVIGQVWIKESDHVPTHGFVDFNINHKCKSYDLIREYAKERQLADTKLLPNDYLEAPTRFDQVLAEYP